MDLGTIRGNLMHGRYDTADECITDIHQVFINCHTYGHINMVRRNSDFMYGDL